MQQKVSTNKTKAMVFYFTNQYQFSTRLSLENELIDIVDETKLLGTIITSNLKWESNTQMLVNKANKRMELLRKISSFGASISEMKDIYILFIRSILEQACVVWHNSLTTDQTNDLERVQKCAINIMLKNNQTNYDEALKEIDLEKLSARRETLCLKFAKKSLKNPKMEGLFKENSKIHHMDTRHAEKIHVNYASTERTRKFPIIYMQTLLNQNMQEY